MRERFGEVDVDTPIAGATAAKLGGRQGLGKSLRPS